MNTLRAYESMLRAPNDREAERVARLAFRFGRFDRAMIARRLDYGGGGWQPIPNGRKRSIPPAL